MTTRRMAIGRPRTFAAAVLATLIIGLADKPTTKNFVQWCEPLYAALSSQFGLGSQDRVWDGRCILLLFKRSEDFAAYGFGAEELEKRWRQALTGKSP